MIRLLSIFSLVFLCLAITKTTSGDESQRSIMLILDASGSMNDRMNGSTRMQTAVSQLSNFVKTLPPNAEVGLVAYGNRIPGCHSARLYSPLKRGGGRDVLAKLPLFFPAGSTPIAKTLELVNKHLLTGHPKTEIVLVSDGMESCDGDPIAQVRKIQQVNPNVRVHVLGLDVPRNEERELQFLAEAGSGEYFRVQDSPSMNRALESIRTGKILPPPEVASDPEIPDFPDPTPIRDETKPTLRAETNSPPFIRISRLEKAEKGKGKWEFRIWYEYESLSKKAKEDHTAMLLFFAEPMEKSTSMPGLRIQHPDSVAKSLTVDHSRGKGKGYVKVEIGLDEKDQKSRLYVGAELWEMGSVPRAVAHSSTVSLDSAKSAESFDKIFR